MCIRDSCRMMPDHDGFAIQSQGTEEDDGLYTPERGGVEDVVFLLAEENPVSYTHLPVAWMRLIVQID